MQRASICLSASVVALALSPALAGASTRAFSIEFSGSGSFNGQAHMQEYNSGGHCVSPDITTADTGSFHFDFIWHRIPLGAQLTFPSHLSAGGERTTTVVEAPCGEQFTPGTHTCNLHFAPSPHSTGLSLATTRGGAKLALASDLETLGPCTGENDASADVGFSDPMDTPGAAFSLSAAQLARHSYTRNVDLAEALASGILGSGRYPLSGSCSGLTCREEACRTAGPAKFATTCSYAVNWTGRVRFTRFG